MGASLGWAQWGALFLFILFYYYFFFFLGGGGVNILNFDIFNLKKKQHFLEGGGGIR